MEKDLLVICPTRGRIKECARMIKSFKEKTSCMSELVFILDEDDEMFDDYEYLFNKTKHSFYVRKHTSLCEMHNLLVSEWFPKYKFYSITCDDYIYHTGSWDQILMNKLIKKGGGFAYGDDGFGGAMLPTTCVISGEIIRALGWIVMPKLTYLCGDVVWRELGHGLNKLFYIPEVKIEHMTYLAGKAKKDDTFKRTNSQETYTNDHRALRAWKKIDIKNDINKIRMALK